MNLPVQDWHYEIDVLASLNAEGLDGYYKVITVYPVNSKSHFTNKMGFFGTWTGWAEIATATKPQEFELGSESNQVASGSCVYSKSQEKRILVSIDGTLSNQIENMLRVATLPEGYRPKRRTSGACAFESRNYGRVSGQLIIRVNGEVDIAMPVPVPTGLSDLTVFGGSVIFDAN